MKTSRPLLSALLATLAVSATLRAADVIKPVPAQATVAAGAVTFTMPAYSAGVVNVSKVP